MLYFFSFTLYLLRFSLFLYFDFRCAAYADTVDADAA